MKSNSTAFLIKIKLRHSLGRPSRSDFVQSRFVCEKPVNKRMLICIACGNGSIEYRIELSKTRRQEVKDTKVEDDSFYLLTLAAVAKELKRRGLAEAKVFLAVGLPLTRFGAEKNDFIKYLTKNNRVSFKYENEPYYIEMDDVAVFPQCYAAVVDKIPTMAKKTQNYICSCVINLIILNHELISEAEFRDIHVRFVKEIEKLDKDDKKNVILYTQLHLIISCLEEVELCLIKMI